MDEYEKANASARQALLLSDQETRAGNADKAGSFNQAAEAFANKLITLEAQIEDLMGYVRADVESSPDAGTRGKGEALVRAASSQLAPVDPF